MSEQDQKIGEILVSKGWLSSGDLTNALKKQVVTREFIGKILLNEKKISEEQLAIAISEQSKIPFIKVMNFYVDWPLALRFSPSLILDKRCFPLQASSNEIIFAITNTLDAWAIAQIESEAKEYHVKLALVTPSDMDDLLERYRHYVNIKMRKQLGPKRSRDL